MNYRYSIISKDEAYNLREKFIKNFVDITNWQYEKLIRGRKSSDVIREYEGYMVSYLWCCFKQEVKRLITFEDAVEILLSMTGKAYVMWDIRPKETINSLGIPYRKHAPYTHFNSDTILHVEIKELFNMITNDHNSNVWEQFLGEDLYVFDDTFIWYIAFTHEYDKDDVTMCYTNI